MLDEIEDARPEIRDRLLSLISKARAVILQLDDEAKELADRYIAEGIAPSGKLDDARHVAFASVNHVPWLISLNYRHLVNRTRKKLLGHMNAVLGYPGITLIAPQKLSNAWQNDGTDLAVERRGLPPNEQDDLGTAAGAPEARSGAI